MKTADNSTTTYLLSQYLQSNVTHEWLLDISTAALQVIATELTDHFEDLELTKDDIKSAWKGYIDLAAHDGTIICPYLTISTPGATCQHDELQLIDLAIALCCKAIDQL